MRDKRTPKDVCVEANQVLDLLKNSTNTFISCITGSGNKGSVHTRNMKLPEICCQFELRPIQSSFFRFIYIYEQARSLLATSKEQRAKLTTFLNNLQRYDAGLSLFCVYLRGTASVGFY